MNKTKNIVFLVQATQHYKKLYSLAKSVPEHFNITFILDEHHFNFDTFFSRDPRYHYVQISSRVLSYNHFLKTKMPGKHSIVPETFQPSGLMNSLLKYGEFFCENQAKRFLKKKSFFRKLCSSLSLKLKSLRLRSELKSYFSASNFDLMILAEANVEYVNEVFITMFKKTGKAVIVYPYTFCTQLEAANSYKNSRSHQYRKAYQSFIDKKWIYEFQGKTLIRMPASKILAIETMHSAPPMPWIQESTMADKIIAESQKIKTHFMEQGIPESQIELCGDISQDIMHDLMNEKDSYKKRMFESWDINFNKKIVLFAIFPDLIDKYSNEFTDYYAMIEWIVTQLSNLNDFNVLLCLHPTLDACNFNYLQTSKIKLATLATSELLPLADLYVSSASASIKMAISLGIPVLNYDVYQFAYGDYLNLRGVVHAETKSQFSTIINQLNNTDLLDELYQEQEKIKGEWGMIDGKSTQRFLELVDSIS